MPSSPSAAPTARGAGPAAGWGSRSWTRSPGRTVARRMRGIAPRAVPTSGLRYRRRQLLPARPDRGRIDVRGDAEARPRTPSDRRSAPRLAGDAVAERADPFDDD